jgi:putative transposase
MRIITAACGYLTPADVHYGRAASLLDLRHRTRLAAYAAHPDRFVQGPPRREHLPEAVWINPSVKKPTRQQAFERNRSTDV